MAAFYPFQQINIVYGDADAEGWALCVWAAAAGLLCHTTLQKDLKPRFASLLQDVKWSSGGFADSILFTPRSRVAVSWQGSSTAQWGGSHRNPLGQQGSLLPKVLPKADPATLTDEFYGFLACPGPSWGSVPLCSTKQLSRVAQMIYDGANTTLPFLTNAHCACTSRRINLSILVFSVHQF